MEKLVVTREIYSIKRSLDEVSKDLKNSEGVMFNAFNKLKDSLFDVKERCLDLQEKIENSKDK